MASLTFKDVGQGDSLILEWESDAVNKVAIIDCKKTKSNNPVVEYLANTSFTNIEFILLSHPHEDHYSGLLDLLIFIQRSKIIVNWFGHTFKEIGVAYWRLFEPNVSATRELDLIFKKIIELRESGLIKSIEYPLKNWQMKLSNSLHLHSLSPSHDEMELYQKKVKLDGGVNKKEASQAANLLSVVFKITVNDEHILTTSDAEIISLERIYESQILKDYEFSLIQVPHHGSIKNYSSSFWTFVSSKKMAVISAGYHLKYKHPDLKVLENLDTLKFTVQSTSIVHGMADYIAAKKKSIRLDMISEVDEELYKGGDKVFHFNHS